MCEPGEHPNDQQGTHLDDIVLGEVRGDRRQALADLVRLVGLLSQITVSDPVRTLSLPSQADLVAVGSKSILVQIGRAHV